MLDGLVSACQPATFELEGEDIVRWDSQESGQARCLDILDKFPSSRLWYIGDPIELFLGSLRKKNRKREKKADKAEDCSDEEYDDEEYPDSSTTIVGKKLHGPIFLKTATMIMKARYRTYTSCTW